MLLFIGDFIGRFHPVLVHLPIGILLLAVLLYFISQKEKYRAVAPAVSIALFWGMCSAIASAISGYLLSASKAYDEPLVTRHFWLGIITAAVSVLAWILYKRNFRHIKWLLVAMTALIVITGHLGGSLTHGEDYLTNFFATSEENNKEAPQKLIPDVQQAVVYTDIIQPMLQAKCYSCHGPNKQKGKLRLDGPEYILAGGNDGKIFRAGHPDESELVKRIVLPHDNKEHMPPKEKPQLSRDEIALLQWWISNGADFTQKVAALPQPAKIKPVLAALQNGRKTEEVKWSDVPEAVVEKADEAVFKKLRERGVAIIPVAQNSNYLLANFVAVDSITRADVELLLPLSKQLVWLKLGNSKCTDAVIGGISRLTALTRLSLEHTLITDDSILLLKNLAKLQYLNLSGTKVTAKGLTSAAGWKKLQQLYLYQSAVTAAEYNSLKKLFPAAVIDTGGYKLASLQTDTILVKAPK